MAIIPVMMIVGMWACGQKKATTDDTSKTTEDKTMETLDQFGGLALYTLRDTLASNPKGILKEVADMGYKYVEAAGYSEGKFYGMTPSEFKNYMAEIHLEPLSSHHGDVTLDNADEMIAACKEAGFQYFVIPVPPMGHFKFDPETRSLNMSEDVEEVTNIINTIAEKCNASGIKCLYHNHNFEFEKNANGIVPMDYFIENTNPEHLNFEIDLYWATFAGIDPIDYFNKAPGRFVAWHVKDMDDQRRFAPVGNGNIDFNRILAEKELSGMEFYFVEQDRTFNETPLEAAKMSHKALGEIGFE